MSDASLTLYVTGNFFGQDLEKTVIEELHKGTDELGQIELFNITARSPEDTGALKMDEFYTANPNVNNKLLVQLGVNTENQVDEWGRVYAQYQEGGDLGLSTYTNGPHEMFYRVLTDDIDAIIAWGTKWCQAAMDRCANGTGVSL